jgi:hypothetical protein
MSLPTLAEFFGYLSAAFWLASAVTPVPSNIWFQAHAGGGAPNLELEKLISRLKKMGWLNTGGALCAAIAIFCQTRGI